MSKKNKPSPPGVLDVLGIAAAPEAPTNELDDLIEDRERKSPGFKILLEEALACRAHSAPDPIAPRLGQNVRLRWGGQCFTAIVAYAYPDGVVNLTVFNHDGSTRSERHVPRAVGSGFGWLPPEA